MTILLGCFREHFFEIDLACHMNPLLEFYQEKLSPQKNYKNNFKMFKSVFF